MNLVVGSGPSGTACAMALLDRGLSVTMLDAGGELEPDNELHRARLARTSPREWPADSVARVKSGTTAGPSGVPLKRVFGSDFPFREPPGAVPLRMEGARALRSFARGGLSRAWGATLLPFAAEDISDWPVSVAELAAHYRAVMKWVPLAAARDGLDAFFPLYTDRPGDLPPSRQARSILAALEQNRQELEQSNVHFGRARLAVRAHSEGDQPGCVRCRLCLYGCPYGVIYGADQILGDLERRPRFAYKGNILVRRVRETSNGVVVDAVDTLTGVPYTFDGDRAFLACGVLTTSQLLMDALSVDEVRIATSQSFLMPLLMRRGEKNVRHEETHALSQIFLVMRDPAVSRRLIQLQIYTYSDLVSTALTHSLVGPVLRVLPRLRHMLEDRLVVLQGLLPSDASDHLVMRREHDGFTLTGAVTSRTHNSVRRVVAAARAIGSHGGFVPLTPMVRLASAGQSFHSGASFPMSATSGSLVSDLLGRAGGLRRIHAVDATVLPDIPAPPLTLTVMANAHRIGASAG